MSEKYYIEVDASSWADAEGVETTVYIGDACEPCYRSRESFEEFIDKELEAHTVHGKLTNKHGYDNIGNAEEFVIALEQAVVYARKRFEELKDE